MILRVLAEKGQPYPVERLLRDVEMGLFRVVDELRQLEAYGLVRLNSGQEDTAELDPDVREVIESQSS